MKYTTTSTACHPDTLRSTALSFAHQGTTPKHREFIPLDLLVMVKVLAGRSRGLISFPRPDAKLLSEQIFKR
jgi:hypothetical protein